MMGGGQGVKNESKIQALIPGPTKLQYRRNQEDRGGGGKPTQPQILAGVKA